jgi:hypothetical protein
VEGRAEASAGRVSGGRGRWRPRGAGRAVQGQLAARGSSRRAAGEHRRETEEEGLEVDDEDLVVIFQKCKDSTIKKNYLSNHSSDENVPKSKSVELNKNYNFALRVSSKRVRDLNLI